MLGQEESCTGDPARRMGNEYVFQMLAQGNIETLDRYRPKTIVTACPHCFNTLGNEYGQLGGHYEVVHHSTYLSRLVGEGRLTAARRRPTASRRRRSLTYHDSCYLARYNGVVADRARCSAPCPACELREMERTASRRFCCGAGGGRMWMEETAARASTPSGRARRSTPAPTRRHGLSVLPGDDARRPRRRDRRHGRGARRGRGPGRSIAAAPERQLPVV